MPKPSKPPRISDAEWLVMETLWHQSPRTAAEVVDALSTTTGWNPRTIKTMLNRLIGKKAIAFDRDGNRYLYRPAVNRASAVRSQSRSFLQRVFGGDLRPMLAHFVEHEKLSPKQITDLRKLLDKRA